MKAFRYTALDSSGRRFSRVAYAADPARLRDELVEARLHPLSIRPALFQGARRRMITDGEAARFARDLSQLLTSGLSATQALGLLAARETPRLAAAIREVRNRLTAGEPLSAALAAVEGQPARFLQALARAGEASGRQAEILASGGASLAAADALKRRLVTLSLYPLFVIAVAVGSIAVYAYAVLPALEPAFSAFGDDIPVQTRAVLGFGQGVRLMFPTATLVAGLGTLALLVSRRVRMMANETLARFLLKPKRSPLRDYVFAGVASRLGVMLGAGVPLAAAWRLASTPVSLGPVARALAAQDARLMEGVRLSEAFSAVPGTPPDLIHYVTLGEQSGRIAPALHDAAAAIGARAQESIERLLSIMTPLVIIVVGVLVALITMMVFQGLLAVGDAVGS